MFSFWVAVILAGWLMWWWNDIRYTFPVIHLCLGGGTKLPPGHMGVPILGEMLSFLWYFKIARCLDDYITSKRRKYGDGVGMYRTRLFGAPSIVVYSPLANKFVFQNSISFSPGWTSIELVGRTSLVAVDGDSHTRVRSFVVRALNQPDSLRSTTLIIQPRITTAVESWAKKGRVTVLRKLRSAGRTIDINRPRKGLLTMFTKTGCVIPKGWKVICWIRYVHTRPEKFQDPLCFNPDRWDEQPKVGTHLVFGGGTRICAGNMLARLQVTVLLHQLVVGYRWELVNPNAEMIYLPHQKPVDEVEINISKI